MELLPIIYVSLAIFAIVAIVTIITSFVSYKVREKTQGLKKPYEREEDPSNKNYMKKKVMNSDGKFHTVISDGKNSEKKGSSKKQSSNKSREKKKENPAHHNKPKKRSGRIEIINKPEKLKLPHLPVKEDKEKSDKDLKRMNENIIEKYTDDKDEEFFSPKISTKKNHKEN